MSTGSAGAHAYFAACGRWVNTNWDSLVELHKSFEAESHSEIDRSVFCSRLFNETTEGRAAAARFLHPNSDTELDTASPVSKGGAYAPLEAPKNQETID